MQRYVFILMFLFWHATAIAAITMNITPTQARVGEVIRLTLSSDDHTHHTPNLIPLKKDFTIIGTEHNMSYSAINGVAKSESQWVIMLLPKREGVLPIPAIEIGTQLSPSGKIEITTHAINPPIQPMQHQTQEQNVTLHTETDIHQAFINQQIIYTVKLLTDQTLIDAHYQPPRVENALIIPLGNGRSYQTTIKGKEYSVDEQQYAIYPQRSGSLQISPPSLTAMMYEGLPKRINIEGNTSQIHIKPIPEKKHPHLWLPAKDVFLSEKYDNLSSTISKGSALERTITLSALGLPAELLPTLTFSNQKEFNVYSEKTASNNTLRQEELVGTQSVKVTYILNKTGSILIPPITLAWFNTQTQQIATATLAGRTIHVMGTAPPSIQTSQPIVPQVSQTTATPTPPTPATATNVHRVSQLGWWIACIFAFAWLLTLMLWWAVRHNRLRFKLNRRSNQARIRKACESNHPKLAQSALLKWGHQQWPDQLFFNLGQLNQYIDDVVLKKQIILLSDALYGLNPQTTWDGKALWQAFENYQRIKPTKKKPRHVLPPLNPD